MTRYWNCRKSSQKDRTGRLRKHYEVKKKRFLKNVMAYILKIEIESFTDWLTKCHRCICYSEAKIDSSLTGLISQDQVRKLKTSITFRVKL